MSIYLYKNNQQVGPYEEATVREWFQNGQLSPNDLAMREGMTEWKPLNMILFLEEEMVIMEQLERGTTVYQALRSTTDIKKETNKLYEHLKSSCYRKHSSFSLEDLRAIDVARDLYERQERNELVVIVVRTENEYVFYTVTESDLQSPKNSDSVFSTLAAVGTFIFCFLIPSMFSTNLEGGSLLGSFCFPIIAAVIVYFVTPSIINSLRQR